MSISGRRARETRLLVEAMDDELVVYDEATDTVHHLNRAAAAIWRLCDGTRNVEALCEAASSELGVEIDDAVVLETFTLLDAAHLLEPTTDPQRRHGMSRRDFLVRVGVASVAIPVVTSIVAPTPAAAATCVGQTCTRTPATCPADASTAAGSCRCNAATGTGSCVTCLPGGATPLGGDFYLCCSKAQQGSSGKCL